MRTFDIRDSVTRSGKGRYHATQEFIGLEDSSHYKRNCKEEKERAESCVAQSPTDFFLCRLLLFWPTMLNLVRCSNCSLYGGEPREKSETRCYGEMR